MAYRKRELSRFCKALKLVKTKVKPRPRASRLSQGRSVDAVDGVEDDGEDGGEDEEEEEEATTFSVMFEYNFVLPGKKVSFSLLSLSVLFFLFFSLFLLLVCNSRTPSFHFFHRSIKLLKLLKMQP